MRRLSFLVLLLGCLTAVHSQEIRPFVSGSMQAIQSTHHGKPFILALWSVDCVHCREDLDLLATAAARYSTVDIVLIAVDEAARLDEIQTALQSHHIGKAVAWIFADSFTERLRYEIDSQWYGELPRTYFYAADGSRLSISGKLNSPDVLRWFSKVAVND